MLRRSSTTNYGKLASAPKKASLWGLVKGENRMAADGSSSKLFSNKFKKYKTRVQIHLQ